MLEEDSAPLPGRPIAMAYAGHVDSGCVAWEHLPSLWGPSWQNQNISNSCST